MTIITIESNSEEATQAVLQYAEEHGLSAKANEHRVLTTEDVVHGIGRKATQAELLEYLLKNQSDEEIDIDIVFKEYED